MLKDKIKKTLPAQQPLQRPRTRHLGKGSSTLSHPRCQCRGSPGLTHDMPGRVPSARATAPPQGQAGTAGDRDFSAGSAPQGSWGGQAVISIQQHSSDWFSYKEKLHFFFFFSPCCKVLLAYLFQQGVWDHISPANRLVSWWNSDDKGVFFTTLIYITLRRRSYVHHWSFCQDMLHFELCPRSPPSASRGYHNVSIKYQTDICP